MQTFSYQSGRLIRKSKLHLFSAKKDIVYLKLSSCWNQALIFKFKQFNSNSYLKKKRRDTNHMSKTFRLISCKISESARHGIPIKILLTCEHYTNASWKAKIGTHLLKTSKQSNGKTTTATHVSTWRLNPHS